LEHSSFASRKEFENGGVGADGGEYPVAAFRRWVKRAESKAQFLYHVGYLAADREKVRYNAGHKVIEHKEEIDALAKEVWKAYERGEVLLVQKTVAPGVTAYYAQKRRG